MRRSLESELQKSCIAWFRLQYRPLTKILFAIPNGGSRNKIEAAKMKAEGVMAGVADLILLTPRKGFGALCIELKSEKGKQQETQKEWQKEAEKYGNKYVICYNSEEFQTAINEYLR